MTNKKIAKAVCNLDGLLYSFVNEFKKTILFDNLPARGDKSSLGVAARTDFR
jgi:hypothetical protein